MARLPDIAGNPNIRRETSPDGTLVIDLHRQFDPRDIHEQSEQSRPELYDARRGVLLLGLTALNRDCRLDWRGDGGVDLHLSHPHLTARTTISVLPGSDGWQGAVDGGAAGPLGQVKMAVAQLADPSRPPPRKTEQRPGRLGQVLSILGVILLFGGGAAWIARDWWHGELRLPKIVNVADDLADNRADSSMINCPAPTGVHFLTLDEQGRLHAPRLTARALDPVPGEAGRYRSADLTITLGDRAVVLWPNNERGQAVTCHRQQPVGQRPAETLRR